MRPVRAHPRLARRSLGWSAWIALLVLVVASAAAAEVFCHEEHSVDEHCAVCQTPHQPATELSGSLQIGSADAADPMEQAREVVRVPSRLYLRQPARAPPA
ncbi:MAG: hypothetical protein F4228_08375 [Acidobacteria bacterium]|nr:hypothetical protein [Acidobacteriota bacterium]MYF14706.1 hypothetical protein [Acidobacteriota bacterium]MYI95460.1 hypothetical protein [Acidobacteriota bacterium]